MFTDKRLTSAYLNAKVEYFDTKSKYIIFSDCHRGDDSASDEFTRNQSVLLHALEYYYENGYRYVEAGDGDELWEYSDFNHRPGLVRVVHTLALLGMLATVLVAIWSYRDDLSVENIQRLYLYLRADNQSTDFSEYTFENGLNTVYTPFGGGLAVASGDTYYFVSGRGGSRFSLQLKYANPAISASDNFVLITRIYREKPYRKRLARLQKCEEAGMLHN